MALLVPSVYPTLFPVIQASTIVLPIAVAVAVLRHRLFDIRVVVGRLVVYGVLTGVLLGVYVLTAVGLARVIPGTTDLGQLLAAAVVALAFAPLRNRLTTSIPGLNGLSFDSVTERTVAVYDRVRGS